MQTADFLVIGGGVAGLSAAAALAPHGDVAVIEAEDALGYHSSGRSVAFSHFGIGDAIVRGLTDHSRDFFIADEALARRATSLFFANDAMMPTLERLWDDMARFTGGLSWADPAEMQAMLPPLRVGPGAAVRGIVDPDGLKLDADALLQRYAKDLRGAGGRIHFGQRIATIAREGAAWTMRTEAGESWTAPVLVNAAGAWADHVAEMAGVRPLGLSPRRRTVIVLDAPDGADVSGWPFAKTATDEFYMLPEAGKLLACPVDEVECDPCDARPEEYDIALTAARVEEFTTLPVRRIAHSWAGLRSFVADRVPTAGFAPDTPGFFWLAGQGGYGLQTAPAMAEIVAALVTGSAWPQKLAALGVRSEHILPDRLFAGGNPP